MLKNVAMLITTSNRSKAYLQLMKKNDMLPSFCIVMGNDTEKILYNARCYEDSDKSFEYFNDKEPVIYTLEKNKIPYKICNTTDVNNSKVIDDVKNLSQEYIVYAGFSGQILDKDILSLGKNFLHVHPGRVPYYKGSTTMYYSLINEGNCGASAIFLNEKIDQGDVIAVKEYKIPKNVPDTDYILDPYIRADLLVHVLKDYKKRGKFILNKQDKNLGETYFIIHPVLKHIAILSEIEPMRWENGE